MTRAKRKLSVAFKRFLAILLVFVINTCAYFYFAHNYAATDEEIQTDYQTKIQKYEKVETVANSTIQDGTILLLPENTKSDVLYEITNDGTNIYARFWIDERINNNYPYSVTFKLSQEFEVIESHYPEKQEYEAFKKSYQTSEHFLFAANAICVFLLFYIMAALVYGIFGLTRYFIRLFKSEKKVTEPKPQNEDSN